MAIKQIKSTNRAFPISKRPRNFFKVSKREGWIVNRGDEFQVTPVCRPGELNERRQTVNRFFKRRHLHLNAAISVFHLSVVPEKGRIIDRGFDSQNKTVLVVHLDGHLIHVMFDACSLNTRIQIIAALTFILIGSNRSRGSLNAPYYDS